MKDKTQIEATLERSLRKQVKVPRLDSRFDAAVWARIEAQESRSAAPARQMPASEASPTARWLYWINIVALGAAAIFLCIFGAQMLAGVDVSAMLPEISVASRDRILRDSCTVISTVAVAIGLLFTPLGQRLREELG
jgi:hypothetical protein